MGKNNYFVFNKNTKGENIKAENVHEAADQFWNKHQINIDAYGICYNIKDEELQLKFYKSDLFVVKTEVFKDGDLFPYTDFDKYESAGFRKA